MSRAANDWRAVHHAATRFEPRLARAVAKGLDKIRERVSISDLAVALANKDLRGALAMLRGMDEAFEPAATLKREAFFRGGKLGAELVNNGRKALS